MESKKFYWLKLKRDFFKRHDIFIIEGMEGGMEISHFYIKLMLESVDHDGELRFNETIPYTPEMLSSITRMSLDSVKRSIEVLESFGLLEQTEDGTYILPKVTSMIDSASDTDVARRARRYREKQKAECDELSQQALQNVTVSVTNRHEIQSKSKRKSKSKSKENIEKNHLSFSHPSIEEVKAYCDERGNSVDPEAFVAFYASKGWKVGNSPMKDWKAAVITWEKRSKTDVKPKPEYDNPLDKYIYGED